MHFNKLFWPRLCVFNSKESLLHNEASKAYLDAHKRIFKMAAIMKVVIERFNGNNSCADEEGREGRAATIPPPSPVFARTIIELGERGDAKWKVSL